LYDGHHKGEDEGKVSELCNHAQEYKPPRASIQ